MDVFYGFLCFVSIVAVFVLVTRFLGRPPVKSSPPFHPAASEEPLPNRYTRDDDHRAGIPDSAIDLWGSDQPNTPEPPAAGVVIGDIADSKFDGKIER